MSCYANYYNFGNRPKSQTEIMSSPLSVCSVSGLDAGFNNKLGNNLLGPMDEQCQRFMASYCAANWDKNGVCDYMSNNTQVVANLGSIYNFPQTQYGHLTYGQTLLRNTAAEKYMVSVSDNCSRAYEPFDPTDPSSPLISKWVPNQGNCQVGSCNSGNTCSFVFDVNPSNIDADPVMNKLLLQPQIAMDILVGIYRTAKSNGNLIALQGTKLHNFFSSPGFQSLLPGKKYLALPA